MDNKSTVEYRATVSLDEAKMFQDWLRHDQNITGLSASEIIHAPKVIVAMIDGRAVGFCTAHSPLPSCAVLSVLFVHPDFRSRGIGCAMFIRMSQELQSSSRTVVASSRNPAVLAWLRENRYNIYASLWKLPTSAIICLVWHACSWYRLRQFIWKKTHGYSLDHFQYAIRFS